VVKWNGGFKSATCDPNGLDILKKGGTAVDAAIAVNAALGLMEPTGSGVGGDLFAIVWDAKTEKLYGLTPVEDRQDINDVYFKKNNITKIPATGPLPVTVPGCVDGWFELHSKFGKLTMDEILSPTIAYAEEGFPVSELVAYYLEGSVSRYMKQFPNVKETYTSDGKYQVRAIYSGIHFSRNVQKKLQRGRDEFYKGEIANISGFIKEQGGFLSYEDLANHHSEWVDPVSTNYRGMCLGTSTKWSGMAALQMLNIIEGYDFSDIPFGSAKHLHCQRS
jgi:gamma-glutamyltranspeptidase/glutathione hydrolase